MIVIRVCIDGKNLKMIFMEMVNLVILIEYMEKFSLFVGLIIVLSR